MSLNAARDDLEARRKREALEKCGKNMGPHDYIPIQWIHDPETQTERVTRLFCRVCFSNVSMHIFIENYPEVTV